MSTFDPGLEPPGDWQTPPSYAPPEPGISGEQAAVWQWVCSAALLLLSCCCGFVAGGMMIISPEELMQQMPPDLPNREQVRQFLPYMGPIIAVGTVVVLLVPAIVLGVLSFYVRSASRPAAIVSMAILGMQSILIGGMALISAINILITRSIPDLLSVLVMGAAVLLFIKTIFELWPIATRPRR